MNTQASSPPLFQSSGHKQRFAKVPAPLGGLALAIGSLGGAWGIFVPAYAKLFALLVTPVAAVLAALVILKYLTNPHLVREDLQHTVISSVMPTLAMALMVIGSNLHIWFPELGRAVWLFAVVAHIFLFFAFLRYRIKDFHITHMVPSWFVPPVGIVVACVTGANMGFPLLTYLFFVFGVTAYAIKLPIMLYRLIFLDRITEAASPTFGIMAAPASLTLAGYLTISEHPSVFVVAVLTPIAVLMTSIVWVALFRLLRLPFSPGFAAFTFPMVIGATALLKLDQLLSGMGVDYPNEVLFGLAVVELLVATAIVIYVAWCYFQHFILKK
ncbi:TDT family transporter [Parendozoicomonas haliclonae]|uniref:Potassium-tellurite ethidium and proflavin transporter n=1 Tax=Parendozoicomonas haliclonae TaxID=1960125 RepID=A0A1X7AMW9_9GAMM|nr:TDT family transporter [Parendozoicomonas haliclonae]SMA49612.1 potassium-tellurite ethidium and proflavin transporter [Parendozoicomonas haliclonae]